MSRKERGAAAVEFAIILPVLFLVVAGIIDFGRYFFVQIQLTNAAREGARAAIVLPNPTAADLTTIRQRALAATAGVPSAAATIVASCSSASPSNATVQVSAPFAWILLGPAVRMAHGTFSGVNGPIVATGVMRCGG
jgi:Flp pilus assembly protein TadG